MGIEGKNSYMILHGYIISVHFFWYFWIYTVFQFDFSVITDFPLLRIV